jgi:hypothetical protein
MNQLNSTYKSVAIRRVAKVSFTAAACGALAVLLACELAGWALDRVSPDVYAHLTFMLIVLLPLAGAAATLPAVRRTSSGLVGPLSSGARSLLLGAGVATFGLVAWHSSVMCWDDMIRSFAAESLGMSPWMYSMWIPFLSAVLAVRQLLALITGRY